ncbi:molybdate ABC transporter substrate-binding protein [Salisediminibacterium halotolerans]|uniref:Molybdate transport system substrate-binding protein n=1 Tax=Salisediminibacterium halotolerans TaxID=517425 RepID=A0A1H9VKI2_9BACI|nr:molybdate ABC transporter substrate-binding protein [Salisediminibacterium haloalkalitolerans]SES22094.1 molybdate transport system substrate-binding protein [Salisediminibacterium haloalkalitolerans]
MKKRIAAGAIILAISSGCAAESGQEEAAETAEVSIAAASDLNPAFQALKDEFEAETGVELTFSFGSTGQLADQIENGAPFDVFASANVSFIDHLIETDDIIEESAQPYAFGRIGLMMKEENTGAAENIADLTSAEIEQLSIANPAHAPYGMAAEEALKASGLYADVENKLVYGRNITDAFTHIETGNADVGIIAYSLGIANEDGYDFILLDEELHEPIEQVIGVTSQADHPEEAQLFIDYITDGSGKETMEAYGFIVPEEES